MHSDLKTNGGGGGKVLIFKTHEDTNTGTGIRVDGDKAVNTKSMNVDAFNIIMVLVLLPMIRSVGFVFTICCDKAIINHAGGQGVANSNSFGAWFSC